MDESLRRDVSLERADRYTGVGPSRFANGGPEMKKGAGEAIQEAHTNSPKGRSAAFPCLPHITKNPLPS